MRGGLVLAVLLVVALGAAGVAAKSLPVVVLEIGGARITATGTVSVEFLGVLPKTPVNTVTMSATDAAAVGKPKSVVESDWLRGLLYSVAGALAVFALQYAKRVFKLEGRAMLFVAALVCGAIAVGLTLLFRESGRSLLVSNPWSLATAVPLVFAVSQVVYRLWFKK